MDRLDHLAAHICADYSPAFESVKAGDLQFEGILWGYLSIYAKEAGLEVTVEECKAAIQRQVSGAGEPGTTEVDP